MGRSAPLLIARARVQCSKITITPPAVGAKHSLNTVFFLEITCFGKFNFTLIALKRVLVASAPEAVDPTRGGSCAKWIWLGGGENLISTELEEEGGRGEGV